MPSDIFYTLLSAGAFFCTFCLLPILFALFIIGAFLVVSRSVQRPREQAWRDLAERLGLVFEPGGILKQPSISGRFREHGIRLSVHTSGSTSMGATTSMQIAISLNNPKNVFLSLSEEGIFSKIGESLGAQDIQIGNPPFDERFTVKSRPPEFAGKLFARSDLRRKLLQTRPLRIEVKGQDILFSQLGVETELDYLLFLIELLYNLAEAVEEEARWL